VAIPWLMSELTRSRSADVRNSHEVRQADRTLLLSDFYFPTADYLDRPTRAFGYYARPAEIDQPVPAILLIHGGGGSASSWWARHWASRGYAALALDLYGQGPNQVKLPDGGPDWSNDFASFRLTHGLHNTWIYHAVAACVSGISALCVQSEVDATRLAVTGQSWGGYFCSTVMSIDDRVKVGMPHMGAAFSPRVATGPAMSKVQEEDCRIQRETFEPGNFLPRCRKPVLWATHPTDTAPDELEKSYRATPGPNTLSVTAIAAHTHPASIGNGHRLELEVFADSILRSTDPLATLSPPTIDSGELHVAFTCPTDPWSAALHWTTQLDTVWHQRQWQTSPAEIHDNVIHAKLPEGQLLAYTTLLDERGCVVSSEFVTAGS
jgi:dienelactone hydrolase